MKKVLLIVSLFIFIPMLFAEDSIPPAEDVDSLFGDNGDQGESGATSGKEDEPDLVDSLNMKEPYSLGADFLLIGGYSPGLNYLPGDPFAVAYADKFVFKFNTSIMLDLQFTPELRVFNKLSAGFPDFLLEINELFCDYNLADLVFMRLGRQKITWGISRNYPFTNLLARLPEVSVNEENADSFSVKLSVPIGTGGFETVAFTRGMFWEPADAPEVADIGYGGKLNLAFDTLDFNIGGFYHRDLNVRLFYSLKTTLFGNIEAYTEGLVAMEHAWFSNPDNSFIGFSANAGFYVDFFDRMVQVNAEYFYNGEKSEQEVKGELFPLVPGHNIALNLSISLFNRKLKILVQGKYNISENSGLVIPAVLFSAFPNLTFSAALPYVIGPVTGTYFEQNDDNDNRRICLVLAIILKGSM